MNSSQGPAIEGPSISARLGDAVASYGGWPEASGRRGQGSLCPLAPGTRVSPWARAARHDGRGPAVQNKQARAGVALGQESQVAHEVARAAALS